MSDNTVKSVMGTKIPVVCGNKTYYLGPATRALRHEMENWLEEQDQREMQRLIEKYRSFCGEEGLQDYRLKLWQEHEAKVKNGDFKLASRINKPESAGDDASGNYLIYLLLKKNHQDMTPEAADELVSEYPLEFKMKLEQLQEESKALIEDAKKKGYQESHT